MTTEPTTLAPTALDILGELPLDMPGITLEPGRINWYHGVDAGKVKTPGVFFGKETAFTALPGAPWESDDRHLDEDGPGFSTPRARIAILGWRDQWFIPGETRKDKAEWLPTGARAPEGMKVKKLIEYLILVDGLTDPMVLSVSGFYKSRPFEDIIRNYERGTLAQLMRQKKRSLPRWVCWLTIGGKTDPKGNPIYEKAKDSADVVHGSDVTPPALLAPAELVSADVMRQGIDTWNLYNTLGWFKYQRTPRDTTEAEYTVSTMPQLPAGRNVPQPVTAGDVEPQEGDLF